MLTQPKIQSEKAKGIQLGGEEWRKELGSNPDGSLGAYGGKKYEGLGVHDVRTDRMIGVFDVQERKKSELLFESSRKAKAALILESTHSIMKK